MILNTGFIIQFSRPTGRKMMITIPLMLVALTVNVLIYTNPKNWFLYDLLGILLLFMSIFLIIKCRFAIDINKISGWRITFIFNDNVFKSVKLENYHRG